MRVLVLDLTEEEYDALDRAATQLGVGVQQAVKMFLGGALAAVVKPTPTARAAGWLKEILADDVLRADLDARIQQRAREATTVLEEKVADTGGITR